MKRETMRGHAIGALFAVGCLVLSSGGALAESACKGIPQSDCEKAANCIWVGSYEKQDGKKVAGYCRTKSTGGTSSKDVAPEKTMPKAQEPLKTKAEPEAKDDSKAKN